jgi:Sulfotransferase family
MHRSHNVQQTLGKSLGNLQKRLNWVLGILCNWEVACAPVLRPVFIVGCPRSGTTLLRQLLDAHPNLSCGPETHFLGTMADIERNQWRQLALFGLSQAEWRSHVRDLFSWVHQRLAEEQGKTRWVDKTPGYALILDFIDQLYPDCQVVHVVRNPRDVIDSYRRRWGIKREWIGTQMWPKCVRAARQFGQEHPEDRYIEVRYEDLVRDPRKVMQELIAWMAEPWDERILESRPRTAAETRKDRIRHWAEASEIESLLGHPVVAETQGDPDRDFKKAPYESSIGIGGRGKGRLVNTPFNLWLDLKAKDLVREMGYA